jgi:opacity protein-like surface antigen
MRMCSAIVMLLMLAAPASAQSTYVGGSLFGEIGRFGGSEVEEGVGITFVEEVSRNGESAGFDARLGRLFGERWGAEFSVAYGGSLEHEFTRRFDIGLPAFPIPIQPIFPIDGFEYRIVSKAQHTTFDSVAFFRQPLSDRVDLAVGGGVSFARRHTGQTLAFTDDRLVQVIGLPPLVETTEYQTGPVVSAEVLFDVTARAAISAGLRAHGVDGGWLLRPAVGLRWSF